MKVIIAGSRSITGREAWQAICRAMVAAGWDDSQTNGTMLPSKVTEVVSGMARGVDEMGVDWAINNWLPWREFPANWAEHGKAAGPIRNRAMADYADALVAIRQNRSRGTSNMIDEMRKLGKPYFVMDIEDEGSGTQRVTFWSSDGALPHEVGE